MTNVNIHLLQCTLQIIKVYCWVKCGNSNKCPRPFLQNEYMILLKTSNVFKTYLPKSITLVTILAQFQEYATSATKQKKRKNHPTPTSQALWDIVWVWKRIDVFQSVLRFLGVILYDPPIRTLFHCEKKSGFTDLF